MMSNFRLKKSGEKAGTIQNKWGRVMFVLGVTGGSGSGKSTICRILEKKGFYIIDCDKIAREVTKKGSPALAEIAREFGPGYICQDKTLDRKKMAQTVFSDPAELEKLNRITHKYIKKNVACRIELSDSDKVLIDAPLLHKSGLETICDLTVAVTAPYDLKIKRIMLRDKISEEMAKKRINSQISDEEYKSLCDFYVENSAPGDENAAADKIYKEVLERINEKKN